MQPHKRFTVIVLFLSLVCTQIWSQEKEPSWMADFNYCFKNGTNSSLFPEIFKICDNYIEKDSTNYREKIAFYVVKGCVLSDSISPDTSIYYLKKILPYSLLTNTGEIITRNYWGIGRSYYKKSECQTAIEYFLQQDYYAEKYSIKKEQVRANYYLSSCFQEIENYAQSNFHAKKAYQIAIIEKDSFAIIRCLDALANNFLLLVLPDSALVYTNLSRKYIAEDDLDNLGYYYGSLGRIYAEKEDYQQAKFYLRQAIQIFNDQGDGFGLSQATENMGHILNFEGKYDSALIYLKDSEYLNELGFYGTPITLYNELYATYKYNHDNEKAFKYLELFVKEDSLIRKFDLNYIRVLKDSFQTEKNDLVILKEKKYLADLYVQKTKYTIFISIAILCVFILGGLLFYYKYKNKKESEKNLITSQLNEVKLRAFQSQMNPHFVFNCLATIDSYILQNRKQEASGMMERFSKLIRLVLENSKQDWVPLEDDLKALKVYLELEQIRATKKYGFEISIDSTYGRLLIPPLIIQPFVENAIVHGVRNIDNGMITIRFKKEPDYLIVEVQDNGVGRKYTTANRSADLEVNKSSLGIALTIDRLQLLDKNKKSLYLEYQDLEGPTGTIARIYIPFKQ